MSGGVGGRSREASPYPDQLAVTQGRMSLAFQSVAPGDYFEFTPDCVLNSDYRVHLEHK